MAPVSTNSTQALMVAIKSDSALAGRLKAAPDLDSAVAIAKEAGFDVTKDELLLEAQEAQAALDERLKAATDLDSFVSIAKEAGFDVTKEKLLETARAQALESGQTELSDEELEAVAGGKWWHIFAGTAGVGVAATLVICAAGFAETAAIGCLIK